MEKDILKPFNYLEGIPKKMGNGFFTTFCQWFSFSEDNKERLKEKGVTMRNSLLIIDDIQDHSVLRRGYPAAHMVYGIPRCIIMADTLFRCFDYPVGTQEEIFAEDTIQQLFAGQGLELHWRENGICPTEEQYLNMVYKKVSIGFICLVNVMRMECIGDSPNLDALMKLVGMHIQIKDDYLSFIDQTYFEHKGFCPDITEGKFSFPIVHAVNNFPEHTKRILEILKLRTTDVQLKEECISILEECGSFKYTRRRIEELQQLMDVEKGKLKPNPLFDDCFETFLLTHH